MIYLTDFSQFSPSFSVPLVCFGFHGILGKSGDLENYWTYQSRVFLVGYSENREAWLRRLKTVITRAFQQAYESLTQSEMWTQDQVSSCSDRSCHYWTKKTTPTQKHNEDTHLTSESALEGSKSIMGNLLKQWRLGLGQDTKDDNPNPTTPTVSFSLCVFKADNLMISCDCFFSTSSYFCI